MRITPYAMTHPVASAAAATMNLGGATTGWAMGLVWGTVKVTAWVAIVTTLAMCWFVWAMCKYTVLATVWLVRRFRTDDNHGGYGAHRQESQYPEGVLFRG